MKGKACIGTCRVFTLNIVSKITKITTVEPWIVEISKGANVMFIVQPSCPSSLYRYYRSETDYIIIFELNLKSVIHRKVVLVSLPHAHNVRRRRSHTRAHQGKTTHRPAHQTQ
jgi:hypothetical protein